jgi:hypothetical protein
MIKRNDAVEFSRSWKQEGYDMTLEPVPVHRSLEQSSVDLSREQRMLSPKADSLAYYLSFSL